MGIIFFNPVWSYLCFNWKEIAHFKRRTHVCYVTQHALVIVAAVLYTSALLSLCKLKKLILRGESEYQTSAKRHSKAFFPSSLLFSYLRSVKGKKCFDAVFQREKNEDTTSPYLKKNKPNNDK